jgi:hypothetical protein
MSRKRGPRSRTASGKRVWSETSHRTPDIGAPLKLEALDGLEHQTVLGGRGLYQHGGPGEGDHPDASVSRGCCRTNSAAASCEAVIRSGATSAARMLPDTSMARMMVLWCEGRVTRPPAAPSPRWRRSIPAGGEGAECGAGIPGRRPAASRTSERLAKRTAVFRFRPSRCRYSQTRREQERRSQSIQGQKKVMVTSRCSGSPPPAASWLRVLRRSAKRRIASTRSSSVESSSASTPLGDQLLAELRFPSGGRLAEAGAEALVVGVHQELLAGLGVLDRHEPQVGERHLEGIEEPYRQDIVAAGELEQRPAPPGRLMKSETTKTTERLSMWPAPRKKSPRSVVSRIASPSPGAFSPGAGSDSGAGGGSGVPAPGRHPGDRYPHPAVIEDGAHPVPVNG